MNRKTVRRGAWKSLEFTIARAKEIMEKEGWPTLPNGSVLYDKGYCSLSQSVIRYHGGMPAFRQVLGQENRRGNWKDLNYTVQQARQAMKEQGWNKLPGWRMLQDRGYSNLIGAVSKYHGGFAAFREKLGQKNTRPSWKNLTYTVQQAQIIMQEQGWNTIPSEKVLRAKGLVSLGNAISRYYGGFPAFRELLAKAQGQPTHKEHLESILQAYTRPA